MLKILSHRFAKLTLAAWAIASTLFVATAPTAFADEIFIDENTPGTVYDAILDGFPNLAGFDGVPDFGGNALGVALQQGVTEERGIIEFPLEALNGLSGGGIEEAILTFNIDDVVSTFGPGTTFGADASTNILIFDFAGDGVVELGDFLEAVDAPLAIVDTSVHGSITDASLGASGPLFFDVDVTEALRFHVANDSAFIGIVFATDDNLSATSVDNLGNSALGPPGVNGSTIPFLTIITGDGGTTTTSTTSTTSTSSTTSTTSTTVPESTTTSSTTTSTTTTSTTTTSSTTTTTLADSRMCGDANGDESITASDALIVLQASVGLGVCPMNVCDVDASATLSAGDALRLLRFAVGQSVDLVCSEILARNAQLATGQE